MHENFIFMHENEIPMHENDISMHENDYAMHENEISLHENEIPCMKMRFFNTEVEKFQPQQSGLAPDSGLYVRQRFYNGGLPMA